MTATSLHQSAGMLEAILQSAVGAIITIDERGIIHSANPATLKLFGYAESELIGRNVKMLMPEPYQSQHDGYLEHHVRTGERRIIGIGREVEGMRKDRSVFPILLAVSAFDVGGKRYFAGIVHDLSARAELKAEVNRQSTLFQTVFDHVPEPLLVTDVDRRILMMNPAATKLFACGPEEMTGQKTTALYASDAEFQKVGKSLAHTLSTGAVPERPILAEFRRKSGQAFPGQLNYAIVQTSEGAKAGILSLIRDMTEENKQAESRVKAQRLEAIGQLTGGIAHDFNNLLTIISGNLELMEDGIPDVRAKDHLKRAQAAAEAGARLTGRLLTFARRRRLEPQVVRLNEQVFAMSELLRRTLGENIELSTKLAPELWPTMTDPSEVENAILNLALNARDAMPQGGRLIIETSNTTLDSDSAGIDATVASGDFVRLTVSDTGIGMSKEILGRAFEPFFTTKPTGKGTGLGLSSIYGFVKQSKGHVSAYSEPGRGTTISIYLPRLRSAAEGALAGELPATPAYAAGEVVLVVEDNVEVRAVTVERLRRLGYRTLEADNVQEAIAHIQVGPAIDAVFSDVVMPGGKSGFDLARWIANNRPGLPVLLTSGFAEDVATEAEHARTFILRKPYAQAELALELRKVLDRAQK